MRNRASASNRRTRRVDFVSRTIEDDLAWSLDCQCGVAALTHSERQARGEARAWVSVVARVEAVLDVRHGDVVGRAITVLSQSAGRELNLDVRTEDEKNRRKPSRSVASDPLGHRQRILLAQSRWHLKLRQNSS